MPDTPYDRDALQALLDFHVEAGVDLALDETPRNRFAEPAAPAPERRAGTPQPARDAPRAAGPAPSSPARSLPKAAAGTPEDAAHLARETARHARSLEELEAMLASFDG